MTSVTDRVLAGRYDLERLLGRGGFSEVFLARDRVTGCPVAVKLFNGNGHADASALGLNHPHLLQPLEIGEDEGRRFAIFEYVPGPTLRELLEQGPLPLEDVRRLAAELGSALDYAHSRGLTHNDVKPENVILGRQGARLLDFGAARQLRDTVSADEAREILATVAYVAPEVIEGNRPDARSDVYSFALVLFEALTGSLPPGHLNAGDPAEAGKLLPAAVPPQFATVLASALSPYRERRPARASDLASALHVSPATVVLLPSSADAAPVAPEPQPAVRRRGTVFALMVASALLGAGLLGAAAMLRWSGGGDSGDADGPSPTPFAAAAPATATEVPPTVTPRPPATVTPTATAPPAEERGKPDNGKPIPKGKAKGQKDR